MLHRLPLLGLFLCLAAIQLVACSGSAEYTDWRLEGPGPAPAGLEAAFVDAAGQHLRRIQVMDLGAQPQETSTGGRIMHAGLPATAIVSALRYAVDDLNPKLTASAKDWVLVIESPGLPEPSRIGMQAP